MIAIVDDDASAREAMGSLIRSLGYTARTFSTAEEFLGADDELEICCLITDVQLTGADGLELQRQLITDGHRIPVIFVTAFPDDDVRDHALGAGAIGFLIKPFDYADLINCLAKAIG
jgi:FixJ family two-component response regulator